MHELEIPTASAQGTQKPIKWVLYIMETMLPILKLVEWNCFESLAFLCSTRKEWNNASSGPHEYRF